MKKVLTVGGATQDVFIEYKNSELISFQDSHEKKKYLLLEEGAKIEIKHLHYATGGGATNSAQSFKKLGHNVSSFFKVGDDEAGKFILQHLKNNDINIDSVVVEKNQLSGTSFIIPSPSGNRTIFTYRAANALLIPEEIPTKKIDEADCLYIASLSGKSGNLLLPICKQAKKHKTLIACNPSKSQFVENQQAFFDALKFIDILILNGKEARLLMKEFLKLKEHANTKKSSVNQVQENNMPRLLKDFFSTEEQCFIVSDFFKIAFSFGPKIVVVTDGSQGVYVGTKDSVYFHQSLPTKVVSTVGAGDAFGSTFVSTLLDNFNKSVDEISSEQIIGQAIVNGLINSSSVVSSFDAKSGLLSLEQLKRKMTEIGLLDLQEFSQG